VVLVLILAALFAYVIAPLVELARRPIRLAGRRRRLSPGAAIGLVYVLMAGSVSGAAALLLPSATEQMNEVIVRAPAYAQSILTWEHGWSRYYERLRIPLELRQSIDQSVLAASEGAAESQGSALALMSLSPMYCGSSDPHPGVLSEGCREPPAPMSLRCRTTARCGHRLFS
jgi:predicted PurR-regulated permease PerM